MEPPNKNTNEKSDPKSENQEIWVDKEKDSSNLHAKSEKSRITKKKGLLVGLISLIIISSAVTTLYLANSINILRPSLGVPTILTPQESFIVEIQSDRAFSGLTSLELSISSAYKDYNLLINSFSMQDRLIYINTSLPSVILTGILYGFHIKVNGYSDSEPNAIKVIDAYNPNFTFAIWSDPQVDLVDKEDPEGTLLHLDQCLNEFNLLQPEFVLLTGDLTEWSNPNEHRKIYNSIQSKATVPIFCVIGNHEAYNPGEYGKYFHLYSYSFNYGPNHHFTMLDSGMNWDGLTEETYNFLVNDLKANSKVPYKYIAMHAPPFYRGPNRNFELHRADFIQLCRDYNITAVFYGHEHSEGVYDYDGKDLPWDMSYQGTRFIMNGDGRGDATYRMITLTNNKIDKYSLKITNSTYDQKKSETAGLLKVQYNQTNVGVTSLINATITNPYPFQDFRQILLTFTIKANVTTLVVFTNKTTGVSFDKIYSMKNNPDILSVWITSDLPENSSWYIALQGSY